ncbi:hypothetical protein [Methanococcoides burtonii]|uniref:hypothetical protein n=1 Tax=Methanococcoides burtonii TaxID=29291 RepID=UPI0000398F4C|nr:hypothetical protein [Methanococcoides burtonii]
MDDDIKDIIDRVFTVQDAAVVEQMLDVINRNISDAHKLKVINEIDQILQDVKE